MKKILMFIFLCLFNISIAACSAKISQSDAERMVVDDNSNHLGKASIILSTKENDGFVIRWKNASDLSEGDTKVFFDGSTEIIEYKIQ